MSVWEYEKKRLYLDWQFFKEYWIAYVVALALCLFITVLRRK